MTASQPRNACSHLATIRAMERPCTCAISAGNCGPQGCYCTTSILECARHGDSEAGQVEAFIAEALEEIDEITT